MRIDIRKKFERAGVTLPPPIKVDWPNSVPDSAQEVSQTVPNPTQVRSVLPERPTRLGNPPDPIVYTAEEVDEPTLSVHLFGNLRRDVKLLNEEIRRLPDSVDDYHGSLQVIAGAATRIKQDTCKLIVAYQEGRGE